MVMVDPDRQETQARAFARRRVLEEVRARLEAVTSTLSDPKIDTGDYSRTRVNWPLWCTASSGSLTSAHQVAEGSAFAPNSGKTMNTARPRPPA